MVALFQLPHREIRSILATGAPVYLPVNPVEYHGPHLALHNDRIISQALIRDVHKHLTSEHNHPQWPLIVADDLEIGVDPVPGPGTRFTSFLQAKTLVNEAVRSLVDLGAKKVVLFTFHGSPLHSHVLELGAQTANRLGAVGIAPMHKAFDVFVNPNRHIAKIESAFNTISDENIRSTLIKRLSEDFHGGFIETSIALHYAPESVSPVYKKLPPCPVARHATLPAAIETVLQLLGKNQLTNELRMVRAGLAWYSVRPFLGYTMFPHVANQKAGSIFTNVLSAEIASYLAGVFSGQIGTVPPLMSWLPWATLQGLLFQLKIPKDQIATVESLKL